MGDHATAGRLWLRILSGPAAFVLVQALRLDGLPPAAHAGLSAYAWVLAWWVCAPIPWAITGFLPLVLFPLGGVMRFADVASLYGQRVFPFLLGIMLFGHAFQKHGLARRMAMRVLSVPGVAASSRRLVLAIMVVSALLSAFVDDAAAVAIMIPIAVSVSRFAAGESAATAGSGTRSRLTEATCLATLYGATAGGLATPAGVPFNPLAISLLEQLTGYTISFLQWTATGVVLMAASLPIYFAVLSFGMGPSGTASPGGAIGHFAQEAKAVGVMSRGEKNVLFVLVVMVVLWFLPAFVAIPGLDIWSVPPLAMVLLFVLPTDARRGEMTLGTKDFQDGVLWNVLFLVVSGTALASGLVTLGVTDWFAGGVAAGVSAAALPWFAGFVTPVLSHLTSGTATTSMVSTILFPIAADVGYNPAILARIIAGTALAVSVPWAGAAAGTAFASGSIGLGRMFRVGVAVTLLTAIATTVLSMVVVPAFGAFTAP